MRIHATLHGAVDLNALLASINEAVKRSTNVWHRQDLTIKHGVKAIERQLRHAWQIPTLIQAWNLPDKNAPHHQAQQGSLEHAAGVAQDTITYSTLTHHLAGATCEDSAQVFRLLEFCAENRAAATACSL